MTRRVLPLAAAGCFLIAGSLGAQLVPLTRCQAAIPCSIPMGFIPADAAGFNPLARFGQGNALFSLSAGVEEGLKPRIDRPPVSQDFSETAARMFVLRNPLAARTPAPAPTTTPKS